MSWIEEFKKFAAKGNVIDLAVGVVMGQAFGKIVSAIVADLIMPLVGVVLPGGDWREFAVTPLKLKLGSVLGATLDFLVVSIVLFLVTVKLMGIMRGHHDSPPTTKKCPECQEDIPIAAKRCKFCTSAQPSAAPAVLPT
jgi:large conductance mechanosensitive channel